MTHYGNLNFFSYPALVLYLNGVAYCLYDIVVRALPFELSKLASSWPYINIPGHLITTFFSVVGALSTYGTGYVLTRSKYYAVLGALLLFTSPLWNASAHFITVDIPLSALCALTLYATVVVIECYREITVKHIALLGILIGLTTSTKYNGALIASSVAAALWFRSKPSVKSVKLLGLCALLALATFILLNPFIFINWKTFVSHFGYQYNSAVIGHPGYTAGSVHYHLSQSLYYGWGIPLLLISGCGAVVLLMSKEQRLYSKLAVLVFTIVHFLMLAGTQLSFQRYALPLIPFLAILAIYFVYQVGQSIRKYFRTHQQRLVWLVTSVALLAPLAANTSQSLRHNFLLQRKDTRNILREAFAESSQVVNSQEIGAGAYSKDFLGPSTEVRSIETSGDLDMIVFDSFTHDRYFYDPRLEFKVDFSRFSKGRVVAISPYDREKAVVPFSPESLYSPYPPDLEFRKRPGPYIEIYFTDATLAQHFSEAVARAGVGSKIGDTQQGYYYELLVNARVSALTSSSRKTD